MQATGRVGPNANVPLNDDELIYIRLNPRTHTPFGLGRLEVAFETISQFLSANRYAGRLASNSVVQYALWLQDLDPAQHDRLIRWWQDEMKKGQARSLFFRRITNRKYCILVEERTRICACNGRNFSCALLAMLSTCPRSSLAWKTTSTAPPQGR